MARAAALLQHTLAMAEPPHGCLAEARRGGLKRLLRSLLRCRLRLLWFRRRALGCGALRRPCRCRQWRGHGCRAAPAPVG